MIGAVRILKAISVGIRKLGLRYQFALLMAIVGAVALSCFEFGFALLLQKFLNTMGLLASDSPGLSYFGGTRIKGGVLGGSLIFLALARSGFQFQLNQSLIYLQHASDAHLRILNVFDLLKKKPSRYVSSAQIHSRFGEQFPRSGEFMNHFCSLMAQAVQITGLIGMMMYFAWKPAVVGLVGLALVGWLVARLSVRVRKTAVRHLDENRQVMESIERVVRNWFYVKIARTEQEEFASLQALTRRQNQRVLRAHALSNVSMVVPSVLGITLVIALVFLNFRVFYTPALQFVSYLYVLLRFTQYMPGLSYHFGMLNLKYPYFKETLEYVQSFEPGEVQSIKLKFSLLEFIGMGRGRPARRGRKASNLVPVESLSPKGRRGPPSIHFENVQFRYSPQGSELFRGLSFVVHPGEQFGVIGQSGSGKSTLLSLLLGLQRPTEGRILVGGEVVHEDLWQQKIHVGYVGAEPFLIAGTVLENLLYGSQKRRSMQDCLDVLRRACLLEVIEALPDGLNTELNANADGLSSGEKQRLALARALLIEPEVLLLDEASSNLDEKTEAQITETIRDLKGRCTVMIISHRSGILSDADRVLDLSRGEVITQERIGRLAA